MATAAEITADLLADIVSARESRTGSWQWMSETKRFGSVHSDTQSDLLVIDGQLKLTLGFEKWLAVANLVDIIHTKNDFVNTYIEKCLK